MKTQLFAALVGALALPTIAAAQVGVDGSIGAEWSGVTPTIVLYNPAAPTSNFGAPTNENHVTGYEIFMRRDANWVYTALRTTSPGASGGLLFANLYFSARSGPGTFGTTGFGIGFEVTNDRAFFPGGSGYYNDTPANLIRFATTTGAGQPDVIEAAFDLSIFLSNSLGVVGYDPTGAHTLRLNLSQSYGFSVAGGQASYGDGRLGYVDLPTSTVPEPSTYALMATGLGLLTMVSRRRRNT